MLKADTNTRHIPIVALTAFAMKGDRERLLAEGFDGYVSEAHLNKRNSSGGRTVSQRAARHRVLGTDAFPTRTGILKDETDGESRQLSSWSTTK